MKWWLVAALVCAPVLGIGYDDVEGIIKNRCAICHKGPFLDLQSYPFYSDTYPTPDTLAGEMLRRIRLTEWRKMPPVNAKPLSVSELKLLEAWLKAGMPR